MKKFLYISFLFTLFSCAEEGVDEEKIIGCWRVEYIDTDGVKLKSGKYAICLEKDGTMIQQHINGKEKIVCEWSLESKDSLLIVHFPGRKPDTMKIIKSDDRDLHIQRRIQESEVTMYLRKQK